jgi:hypothetical protein
MSEKEAVITMDVGELIDIALELDEGICILA